MKKLSFGLFGLFVLLGDQFGSTFGMAVAICSWMVLDGLIDEIRTRPKKNIKTKKEDK